MRADTVIQVPATTRQRLARPPPSYFTLQAQGESPLMLAFYTTIQSFVLVVLAWTAGGSTLRSCS